MTPRRSKREIENAVEDLDEVDPPETRLTLVELLSYEIETVDEEAGIVRVVETGDLRRQPDPDWEALDREVNR